MNMTENHLPLVSILIPTHNRPHFFKFALDSALRQTYPNIEIIVTDNSTNDETYEFIKPFLTSHPHIKYFRNEENIGPVLNFLKAYELSSGEYIHYLMDDDVFHPNKIERMMTYFLNDVNEEISLITSQRAYLNEHGYLLPDNIYNRLRSHTVKVFEKNEAGDPIISDFNWIGVPSTTLFRRKKLTVPYGWFSGRIFRSGVDCAAWLTLLQNGKLLYIPEVLCYIRLHSGGAGQGQNAEMSLHACLDLMHMLFHSRKNGYLLNEHEFLKAIATIEATLSYIRSWNHVNQKQKEEITYYLHCLNILKANRDV